jgi:WD40 repeat protein
MYNRLAGSVRDWVDNGRDASFLVRDVQLLQYEEMLESPIITLTADEQQYMSSSQALHRRNQQLRYGVILSLVILTLVSVIVSFIAIDKQNQANIAEQVALGERDRANRESDISQSRALSATALNSRAAGRDALLMAIQANNIADTFEAHDSLANILIDHGVVERYYLQDVPLRNFVVTSDSQMVYTVGDSNAIMRWDLSKAIYETLTELTTLSVLNTIALNTDETVLAVGGEGGYALLDVMSGEIIQEVNRDADIWSLIWSLDSTVVYGIDSLGAVFAYDLLSQAVLFDVAISSDSLLGMALDPIGQTLAVGGTNNIIYVLDMTTGDVLYEFEGHSNWILSLAYSPDGELLASGGADLSIIVWDVVNLQALGQIPTGHTDWIRQIEFSSDGTQMLTSSADGTLKRWDTASGRQVSETLTRHTTPIWSASYLSEDRMLSADRSGQLIKWSLSESNFPMVDLQQLDTQIIDVVEVDGFESVAVATNQDDESASLLLINLLTGDIATDLSLPSFVTSMGYHSDGELLAVAGVDQIIRLVDMSNPVDFEILGGHDSIILDVEFSLDGQTLISVDDRGTLIRWDVASQTLTDEIEISDSPGLSLIRYLNTVQFVTADRAGMITVWDAETLEQIRMVDGGHDGVVTDIVLTDDGKIIYSVGRDGLIMAWDTQTWNLNTVFPHIHTDWILDIALVDNQSLATTGRDGTLIVWNIDRQQPIGQPFSSVSTDWGVSILIDENTQNAYSLHRDGQIIKWELGLEDWLRHGCNVANIMVIPSTIEHLIDDTHYCISS